MSAPPASPRKATLFRQEAPGGLTYRIPALLYLPPESTFLAFAEKRSSFRDEHAESLVMRRGLRDGLSVQWGPQEALETAVLPGHRTMNPCPLYDRKSGKVFLFFICVHTSISEWHQIRTGRNAARLCYVASPDGGRTWSPATDLTEQVIGGDLKNWATFAVGPGHGVQLRSGRLVVPAYAYYIHEPSPAPAAVSGTHPHCFVLYSDDGGWSWSRSQLLMGSQTTECQVAEVTHPDSRRALYVNARNQSQDRCRVEAVSSDEGSFFEGPLVCQQLCEPPHGCQGSVVSFTPQPGLGQKDEAARSAHPSLASHKSGSSWLMFSHPTHCHKRLDLGIYLNPSPLEEGGWKAPWVLHSGPSGYSDLAVCEGGESLAFGCLFECGVTSPYEEIAFRLFTDGELLENVMEACACPASPSQA
ncbi:sialidase-3-like [Varanus komodoensis]|uniref:exo-alpha-sialidase n=1 Tax=Varanus komodoensis TaxID=61221 RepID=A0A8D2J1B4_VARKO|nr:sialidase-3-like [Varanus komodoensis]XP_044306179.1 sialidase-3-like [Varanus komodoensis]